MATKRRVSAKRFLAAIESGDIELVQRLLARGADVRGCWRESPSVCAVRNGYADILALFLRHGIDPRENDNLLFGGAIYWRRPAIVKLLATTVFAPDLWRGKALKDIQEEADLIYTELEKDIDTFLPEAKQEASHLARLELFDAAMTCWEHVRPDPPKINISPIPAKGKAL
jgi:hypothetical protein